MDYKQLEELRQTSQKTFFEAASKLYDIEEECLIAFLEDYEVEPRGSQGPSGDEAVPFSMREIAAKVNLKVKVVGRLQDLGIISSPITCDDFEFLKSYRKTWGVHFFLRNQIAKLSQSQREDLLKRPELSNKWERWTYDKYFSNKIEYGHGGRMITPERRILIEELAEDIESMFRVPNCKNTRDRIEKIREIANNDRKKVSQGKATERSVLKSRNLPESELELFADSYVFLEYS